MGDAAVKRRANKNGKINRIVSLFEIPRPNKGKGLQRTNSLPASKRPSIIPSEETLNASRTNTTGRVKKIKEEIENKTPHKDTTFVVKHKTHSNKKNVDHEIWQVDKERIMEDINRLQEKIEDVTKEIEHSDTELEIAHQKFKENDDIFTESIEILRDKTSEQDDCDSASNRLSTETMSNRLSSDTIKDLCEVIDDDNVDEGDYSVSASQEINLKNDTITMDSIEWWKHKSFVQITNESTKPSQEEKNEEQASPILGGRFIKNNRSSINRRNRRRTGILQKPYSVKEMAKHFESFKDAAESGETENYRKSFIHEMDLELENMKMDGFQDDFHLSFENLTLLDFHDDDNDDDGEDNVVVEETIDLEQLTLTENDKDNPLFQTIIILPNQQENEYLSNQDQEDFFGETLFSEDLENGLYYLETYNADGKELIMCNVQVDRQSVDLNSFDEMKAKSQSSILTNDDRMLVLLDADSANESKSGTDSKRTTIYSTTSGESYEDEENTSNPYSAARRETYCDDQGVVRIERVAPLAEGTEEAPEYVNTMNYYYTPLQGRGEESVSGEEENYYESIRLEHEILFSIPQVKKETLQYILEEIMSTERKYVSDMKKVLNEYKTFLEERCPERVEVVFANMAQIYQMQLQFLQALEIADMNVKEVVQVFIDFEDLFRLYPRYFKNTPKANAAIKELSFLIKEKQDRISDKLDLSAYLLTPLQRIGKYKLFLENIIKQLEKEQVSVGFAQMALDIVKKYMSKGNDAVAIASILYSPLHTKDYGSFITREKFLMIKPKRLELMVFLFEGAVVFTTEDPKNMEQFVYHQSIKTNDLRIATFDDTTIHLTDYTKIKKRNSSKYTYVLDAKNSKLKASWKQQIEDILWKQMKKIKENTLKEYQSGNKAPKKAMRTREQRSKSTGSSIFYVE